MKTRYYKRTLNGKVILIGTGEGGEEITREEYDSILERIRYISGATDAVLWGEASIEDYPEEVREEILSGIDKIKKAIAEEADSDGSD